MIPVKLPGRHGWLCGTCATWYRWRYQVCACCSEDDGFTVGEWAGAAALMLCIGFFIGAVLPHLA